MAVTIVQAREAKTAAKAAFSRIGRVVGVGITRINQDYAVKINLRSQPAHDVWIPREVNGVPILVEVVGKISATAE